MRTRGRNDIARRPRLPYFVDVGRARAVLRVMRRTSLQADTLSTQFTRDAMPARRVLISFDCHAHSPYSTSSISPGRHSLVKNGSGRAVETQDRAAIGAAQGLRGPSNVVAPRGARRSEATRRRELRLTSTPSSRSRSLSAPVSSVQSLHLIRRALAVGTVDLHAPAETNETNRPSRRNSPAVTVRYDLPHNAASSPAAWLERWST